MPVDRELLNQHLRQIATTTRPAGSPELAAARDYVMNCLAASGWQVASSEFSAISQTGGTSLRGVNLVAQHGDHRWEGRPRLCLGAHLDTTENSPGADDNGSAVAALLEIARLLPENWPEKAALDLELVVFDLEEHGMLGSAHRAQTCRRDSIDLRGMVALEMLGYCDSAPKSQGLPRSLVGKYPDIGNWIAVIGNQNSTDLIAAFRDGLKSVDGLPVETLQVPENGNLLQATRLSDHSPYWDAGYPALMITDTAFLRNPHYHLPSDTIDTLDLDFLARVTEGCLEAVRRVVTQGL
ncbi:MAG: M28 family peptidase [Planctomycetaceae bacterium]|nr:M28 family peptidase [Planctomycetaceae bacterium]